MDNASAVPLSATIVFQRRPEPVTTFVAFAGDDEPESDSASRAKAKSDADWKRCSRFFSRWRCTIRCNAGGMFAAT